MIPASLMCIFVIQEICTACQIKVHLLQASRQGARAVVAAQAQGIDLKGKRALQNQYIFSKIIVPGAVTHPSQFDDILFDTRMSPATVTITTHYRSDARTALPPFPTLDPLNLGKSFDLRASATYSLE